MAHSLTPAQEAELLQLFPFVRTRRTEEQVPAALEALFETERVKRGTLDPVTSAFHVTALTHGSLLKAEYDLSIHAHTGFPVAVLTCDVKEMILFNQRHGFARGDAFLRGVVERLRTAFPSAPIVRMHTDCFAVLGVPSSELAADEALRSRARDAVREAVPSEDRGQQGFTLGLLALRIHNPSHWQVLGPLVWAEAERLHTLARAGKNETCLVRGLDLEGRVDVR